MSSPFLSFLQPRLLILSAVFTLGLPALADFPALLVIDGVPYAGTSVSDPSFNACYEYDTPGGVLMLRASGEAGWGVDADTLFANDDPSSDSPWQGTWNGSDSVSVPGHGVAVPGVVLYLAAAATPTMDSSDGASSGPLGSAFLQPGQYVCAYAGPADGAIISFEVTGSGYYRYRAGPSPALIDARSGWPPSNVATFPADFQFYEVPFTAGPVQESFSPAGYTGSCAYSSPGGTGAISASIDPQGASTGSWSFSGSGYNLSGSWDPATGAGLPLALASQRGLGPWGIAWNGMLFPFRYHDARGADQYADVDFWNRVSIDGNGAVTATLRNGATASGTYDAAAHSFSVDGFHLAAVSEGGQAMLGLPEGIAVTSSLGLPGTLRFGNGQSVKDPDYLLRRADGSVVAKFVDLSPNEYFTIADSPLYLYTGGEVSFDLSGGASWPASNLPALPTEIYVNGLVYHCSGTSSGGGVGTFWDFTWYENSPTKSALISFGDDYGTPWQSAYVITAQGTFYGQVDPYSLALSGFPAGVSITVGPSYTTPALGPPQVAAFGQTLRYTGSDSAARDTYQSSSSDLRLTIDSAGHATLSAASSGLLSTGQYGASTFAFVFPSDLPTICIALDDSGNPIALAPGLAFFFGGDSYGQTLALGDGTARSAATPPNGHFLRSSTLTWEVKYLDLPDGALFIASDNAQALTSPIYRYHAGGTDQVIDASGFGWPSSNLFPAQLFVNGQLAQLDLTSPWSTGSGTSQTGGVSYLIQGTSEAIAIAYQWQGSFSASVSGSYDPFGAFQNGVWDGGRFFTSLPSGLVITLDPLPGNPHLGPPKIEWEGLEFAFDPVASAISGSNPTGRDVYRDALGLSLSIAIADNGSGGGLVTLTRADGAQETGAYDPVTGKFTVSGAGAGSLTAVDVHGNPYDPSGTNAAAGGTLGAPSETTNILGNLDIHGSSLTLGTWTDSQNNPTNGFGLNFSNASGDQHAALDFSAVRPDTDWTWSHVTGAGGSQHATAMRVDASHRLILYDPAHPGTPAIILDPAGKSHLEPQGDISMGEFTASPP